MSTTQRFPANTPSVIRADSPSGLPGTKALHFEITSWDTNVYCPGRFYMSGALDAVIRELSYDFDVPRAELGIIIRDDREALAETADQLPLPKKSGPAFVLYNEERGLECVVRPLSGGCVVRWTRRGLVLQ